MIRRASKFVDGAEFHRLATSGRTSGVAMRSTKFSDPFEVSDRTLRFVFSDETTDRMGDVIKADGWDTTDFVRNPVALWSHNAMAPPIGQASNVMIVGTKLMGSITFADAATYDFSDQIFRLYKAGYLKAVSVGFMPTRWSFTDDPARKYGIDFLEQQLLEISCVTVPANSGALLVAASMDRDRRVNHADDGSAAVILAKRRLRAAETRLAAKLRAAGGKHFARVQRDLVRVERLRRQAR